KRVHKELLKGIAHPLQQMLRPLDVNSRLEQSRFAKVTLIAKEQECTSNTYKRLYDCLHINTYKYSEGSLTVQAHKSRVTMRSIALPCEPAKIMELAQTNLAKARAESRLHMEVVTRPLI